MKKNAALTLVAAAVALALFNVIAFVIPHESTSAFWWGYSFTTLAFLLLMASFYLAFTRAEGREGRFLGLSIVQIAFAYLGSQVVFGLLSMFVPRMSATLTIVVGSILLAAYLMATIVAVVGRGVVQDTGDAIKARTFFIKSLTVDLQNLGDRVSDPSLKKAVSSVTDAVRYSDPMSSDALSDVEGRIELKAAELRRCVDGADLAQAGAVCGDLERLCAERSRKCKLLK